MSGSAPGTRTQTTYIVVHHAATPPSCDVGAREINHWHLGRGFAKIGYHFVIRRDGEVEPGRFIAEIGAHAKGYNAVSVSVCLMGGVAEEDRARPEFNFTAAQLASLRRLLAYLKRRYPGADIVGHKDLNPATLCPGFDVRAWLDQTGLDQAGLDETGLDGSAPAGVTLPATWLRQIRAIHRLATENPATTAFQELRQRQLPPACHIARPWVSLENVSPFLLDAVVSYEDPRFWTHGGLDYRCIWDAVKKHIRTRQPSGGASTITQQLVKNLYLSPERRLSRKIREMLLALSMERMLSKQRILELYINAAEWGNGIFGAAGACRYYFDTTPDRISLLQAVQLAAILPAPRRYTFATPALQDSIRLIASVLERGERPAQAPDWAPARPAGAE